MVIVVLLQSSVCVPCCGAFVFSGSKTLLALFGYIFTFTCSKVKIKLKL